MIRRDRSGDHQQLGRYRTLALAGAGISGVIGGAIAYASLIEPRTILRRDLELALPSLPPALNGLRIAFLSDFHLGGPGDPSGSFRRALSILEDEKPDLILLGGDYYDRGETVPGGPEWARFPEIAPTFAVPGNHDYHRNAATSEAIMATLRNAGISLLRNETRLVTLGDETVRIVGLDDPYTGRADFELATRNTDGDSYPTIMLAHAGLIVDELPIASADLILSGHTHSAQINFSPFRYTGPLDIFWWLDYLKNSPLSPYKQGMFHVRGSLLYVGNGLGTTSLGMRFMAPPEVAIFQLRAETGNEQRPCDSPERYVLNHQTTRMKSATS